MKKLIALLILVTATSAFAATFQVLIKVPVTVKDSLGNVVEQHSDPDSVQAEIQAWSPQAGTSIISNKDFTIFTHTVTDTLGLDSLRLVLEAFTDVEIGAVEMVEP